MNDLYTGPVTINERISSLDILRGIALFGILTINIASFTPGGPPGFTHSPNSVDNWLTTFLLLFVESKFFTLFSFLFGLGFSIQLIRAKQRGDGFVLRFSRRLGALSIFGLLHIVLLWDGDILLVYAIVGFILLLFRNCNEKTLLKWVSMLLLIPNVIVIIGFSSIEILRSMSQYANQFQQFDISFVNAFKNGQQDTYQLLSSGSFSQLISSRVTGYIDLFPLLLSRVPTILAMFLLGFYVGKKDILQNISRYQSLLKRLSRWGIGIGLTINIIIIILTKVLPPIPGVVILLLNQTLTGPILSLSFASVIVLGLQNNKVKYLLSPFSNIGRMALTNYILQSVLYSFIFYSYGLGLSGKIGTWQALIVAIVFFVFQICLSNIWLKYFRFGPLEWIWKSISYWKIHSIK
ncbi:DUF418 domain-containing protein [Priestia megaterium]|uniref:DUF418 domain-containing protein n=1 Tax=Priestia megaterium TaxID=1404 RepID=UPI003458616A